MFNYKALRSVLLLLSVITIISSCSGGKSSVSKSSDELSRVEQIKAAGKLVVVTSEYYPFEYINPDTGLLVGYDIDLVDYIAGKLGVAVEWKIVPFTELLTTIQNNQADIGIGGLYITDGRKKIVEMTDAYLDTGMSLVRRTGDSSITSMYDLIDKTVGVKRGGVSEQIANQMLASGIRMKVISYDNTSDYLEELQQGEIDAAFNDYLNQMGFNKQHPNAKLEIVGGPFENAHLGIAVQKNDVELLAFINEMIEEHQESGNGDLLYSKWLQ